MLKQFKISNPIKIVLCLLVTGLTLGLLQVIIPEVYIIVERGKPITPGGRYLIPQGYTGRVRIYYGVAGALPLPREDRRCLYVIPPSGKLQTCEELDERWHEADEYFAVKGKQRISLPVAVILEHAPSGPAIWDNSVGRESVNGGMSPYFEEFLVMTKKQHDKR